MAEWDSCMVLSAILVRGGGVTRISGPDVGLVVALDDGCRVTAVLDRQGAL